MPTSSIVIGPTQALPSSCLLQVPIKIPYLSRSWLKLLLESPPVSSEALPNAEPIAVLAVGPTVGPSNSRTCPIEATGPERRGASGSHLRARAPVLPMPSVEPSPITSALPPELGHNSHQSVGASPLVVYDWPSVEPSTSPSALPSSPGLNHCHTSCVGPTPMVAPAGACPSIAPKPSPIPSTVHSDLGSPISPSSMPLDRPRCGPSREPSWIPKVEPSDCPSLGPSVGSSPSKIPSVSTSPRAPVEPSLGPNIKPSDCHSFGPSLKPSSSAAHMVPCIGPLASPSVSTTLVPKADPLPSLRISPRAGESTPRRKNDLPKNSNPPNLGPNSWASANILVATSIRRSSISYTEHPIY
jgi:hypothetical protein